MTKTGSGDSAHGEEQGVAPEQGKRPVPLPVLLLGILGLFLAAYVGTQAIPVLYSLVSPPRPPLPQNAQEIFYQSPEENVDVWDYTIDAQACRTLQFYLDQEATCVVTPEWCGGGLSTDLTSLPDASRQVIARCKGDMNFTVFAMRWDVEIRTADEAPRNESWARLTRRIYWGGVLPPDSTPAR